MKYTVACLDVYDQKVKEIIYRHIPEGFELNMASSYNKEEQKQLIKNSDVILTGWSPVPESMFQSKKLKFVQKFGVGFDKIDLCAAKKAGVGVAIAAGMNAVPVSELVVLLILSIYRKLLYLNQTIHEGKWVKSEMRSKTHQIYGKTIGLIGLGSVGKEVAKRLKAFDTKILYYDKFKMENKEEKLLGVEYRNLIPLLKTSDIISIHVPLTKETFGFMDKEKFNLMKENSIIINTARGEIIDEDDLVQALEEKKLLGAGLDVFLKEPIPKNHQLLEFKNVVLTPHIGGSVLDNVDRMAKHCFENIYNYLNGKPLSPNDVIVGGKINRTKVTYNE